MGAMAPGKSTASARTGPMGRRTEIPDAVACYTAALAELLIGVLPGPGWPTVAG